MKLIQAGGLIRRSQEADHAVKRCIVFQADAVRQFTSTASTQTDDHMRKDAAMSNDRSRPTCGRRRASFQVEGLETRAPERNSRRASTRATLSCQSAVPPKSHAQCQCA